MSHPKKMFSTKLINREELKFDTLVTTNLYTQQKQNENEEFPSKDGVLHCLRKKFLPKMIMIILTHSFVAFKIGEKRNVPKCSKVFMFIVGS
jgi:hypothetical protein